MKLNASLSITYRRGGDGEDCVEITIDDEDSRIAFVTARISYKEFTMALSSCVNRPLVGCEVTGLQYVGKKKEQKPAEIRYTGGNYDKHRLMQKWLAENGGEAGWHVDGSQGGVFHKENEVWLRYTLYRFIDADVLSERIK